MNRPKVGDRCWEVEWCSKVFIGECGDIDPDRNTYEFKLFKTQEAARHWTEVNFSKAAAEYMRITPMLFVAYDEADARRWPHAGFWEATGDSEYVESEDLPTPTERTAT